MNRHKTERHKTERRVMNDWLKEYILPYVPPAILLVGLGAWMHHSYSGLSAKIDTVSFRIDAVGGRIDEVNGRIDDVNGRIDTVNETLSDVRERLSEIEVRVSGIEERVSGIEARVSRIEERVPDPKSVGRAALAVRWRKLHPAAFLLGIKSQTCPIYR